MVHDITRDGPRPQVLIVDDDRRLLWALGVRLEQNGCRCITCNNASEAMVQFATADVELVITDLSMPGIDGMSLVGLIRCQSDVPVIVVTGNADDYGRLIKRYEHVTLIRKPFEPRELVACVHAAIHRKRTRHPRSA
jgi:DNA-binding response OmpR family regulator